MRARSTDPNVALHWTVDDLITAAECRSLIGRVDALGPTVAPVTTARGPVMRPDIRNNERVMVDDQALADELYARALPHLPPELMGGRVCGVNERFRFYRYQVGQRFAPHFDGAFIRNDHEESFLTFMVYLNEGFSGGDTHFLDGGVRIEPRAGRALFFQHMVLHEGSEVTGGVKYVMRTDVMYRLAVP